MNDHAYLDLDDYLPYLLTRLTSIVAVKFASEHAYKYGLSIPEWRVLAVLGRYPGASSATVTGISAMNKAKVSRAVTRLTAAGLIKRQVDSADKRSNVLNLSHKGKQIHDEIVEVALRLESQLTGVLSEGEVIQLKDMLNRLYTRIAGQFGPHVNHDPFV